MTIIQVTEIFNYKNDFCYDHVVKKNTESLYYLWYTWHMAAMLNRFTATAGGQSAEATFQRLLWSYRQDVKAKGKVT